MTPRAQSESGSLAGCHRVPARPTGRPGAAATAGFAWPPALRRSQYGSGRPGIAGPPEDPGANGLDSDPEPRDSDQRLPGRDKSTQIRTAAPSQPAAGATVVESYSALESFKFEKPAAGQQSRPGQGRRSGSLRIHGPSDFRVDGGRRTEHEPLGMSGLAIRVATEHELATLRRRRRRRRRQPRRGGLTPSQ